MDILKKLRISGRKSLVPNILKAFGKPAVPRTEAVMVKKMKKAKPSEVKVEPKVEVTKVVVPEVPAKPVDKVKKVEEPKVVEKPREKMFFDVYNFSADRGKIPVGAWNALARATVSEGRALVIKYKSFIDAAISGFNLEDYRRK